MKNEYFKNESGCYIIAEAGLNHNGSIEIAKKLIELASIAGVDAVKFQKRTVDKLAIQSTLDAEDNRFPEFGKTYREIREHLEFNVEEYRELFNYSKSRGLEFIVTAFDIDAVDFLESLGIKLFKLASHSLTNINLLEYLAVKKMPTILSTGMADLEEIDNAVDIFVSKKAPLALMHCVSSYPTPLSESNLAMIDKIKERYELVTGYSGHEIGYLPTIIAVTRGAQIIERHFTLDKSMVGFDHKMSLGADEFISMVKDIRIIKSVIGSGKKIVSETEWITRRKYHVSMASAVEINSGTVLTEDMVTYKNPGTGVPYKLASTLIGRRAVKKILIDQILSQEMFE